MEELIKTATVVLARLAEACGALVIGHAVVRALILFVLNVARGPAGEVTDEAIRLSLGRSLALGLEFLLGADILNTAVAPSWEQVGLLAAIAAIRMGLNHPSSRSWIGPPISRASAGPRPPASILSAGATRQPADQPATERSRRARPMAASASHV